MATKYRIVAQGIPAEMDSDGYDTRTAAEGMAAANIEGEYRVEEYDDGEPTKTYYAAIDTGSDISGAVYGVGTSEAAALRNARRLSSDGEYAIVPCTEAAYKYVKANGGAPSSDLSVSWRRSEGVALRSEEA